MEYPLATPSSQGTSPRTESSRCPSLPWRSSTFCPSKLRKVHHGLASTTMDMLAISGNWNIEKLCNKLAMQFHVSTQIAKVSWKSMMWVHILSKKGLKWEVQMMDPGKDSNQSSNHLMLSTSKWPVGSSNINTSAFISWAAPQNSKTTGYLSIVSSTHTKNWEQHYQLSLFPFLFSSVKVQWDQSERPLFPLWYLLPAPSDSRVDRFSGGNYPREGYLANTLPREGRVGFKNLGESVVLACSSVSQNGHHWAIVYKHPH